MANLVLMPDLPLTMELADMMAQASLHEDTVPIPNAEDPMPISDVEDSDEEEAITLEHLLLRNVLLNDVEGAKHLILNGASVNFVAEHSTGSTLLSMAVVGRQIPMIRMLLEYGADISQEATVNYNKECPIVTAARMSDVGIMELLLEHGGAPRDYFMKHRQSGKAAMYWAVFHGDVSMASMLLSKGANINCAANNLGDTPLHMATAKNHHKMVMWLLDSGAQPSAVNNKRRTPLHIAAIQKHEDIFQELVDAGAAGNAEDTHGYTPIGLACSRGSLKSVHYCIEYSPLPQEPDYNDCLHQATSSASLEVMDYLLKKGAEVNAVNDRGETPLAIASRGKLNPVLLLLSKGAQINILDKRGYTPLQLSLLSGFVEVSTVLIRHGADFHAMSVGSESPLELAYNYGDPLLLHFIIKAGCSLNKEKWFNAERVMDKVKELDFCKKVRLNGCSKNSYADSRKSAWLALTEHLRHPRSLKDSCRISIRQCMVEANHGRSMLKFIPMLPLPSLLKHFLCLDDIIPQSNPKSSVRTQ